MFKNYLKIALRSFAKQRLTSSINIIGLSIGIACASLGYLFVQHELSYDKFHEEYNQIYWLSSTINENFNLSGTPGPLAMDLKNEFPEVTEGLRLEEGEILIQSGNEFFKEKSLFVDANFFEFFNFSLVQGQAEQVLSARDGIVLTESMAKKYFGRTNPVGQSLKLQLRGEEYTTTITGVAANPPQNTSIDFNILLPLEALYRNQPEILLSAYDEFPLTNFIRLRQPEDLLAFEEKLPTFVTSKMSEEAEFSYAFNTHALHLYHLDDGHSANGLKEPADISYVKIMGIIAVLILIVACFNFMNLANAQGSKRLLEVGVRRVLGAERRQLIGQFLSEAVLLSVISLGIGIVLLDLALPFVAQVTGFPLEIQWTQGQVLLPLLGISILTGLLAGAYPALLFSKLRTVQTFKSGFKAGGNNWVTKGSLIFQFALSIGLLSCTFIMYQQQQYIKDKHLGFDQEQIVVIPTQFNYEQRAETERFVEQFKQEIKAFPNVLEAAGVSYSFNRGNAGIFIREDDGSNNIVFQYEVEPDYLSTLSVNLKEGRNFSLDQQGDRGKAILVNQAFIDKYEIASIEGYKLPEKFEGLANQEIIGVLENYNFLDLKSQIRPMVWAYPKEPYYQYMLAKISPEKVDETINQLKTTWQAAAPSKPFEFFFLDEDIQSQYETEARWQKAISGATILAIVIACLGLFGLIALILIERTKEIGIRKVLGASIPDITWLVSRQFVFLLLIASTLAIPVSWWAMQKWLADFAFSIDIQLVVFIIAVGVTLAIALLTSGLQSAKAATRNPVDALRYE